MENRNLGLSDGDDLAPNSALAVDDLAGDVDLERCDAWAHDLLVLGRRAAGPRPLDDAAAPKPLPCDGYGAAPPRAGRKTRKNRLISLVISRYRYRGQWCP